MTAKQVSREETIMCLGNQWTIMSSAEIDLELSDDENWAITDHLEHTIKIRRGADPTYLIHELLHVIEKAFQMEFEDQDIHLFARGLRAIGVDNPFLIKEMFA